jgi:Flp pilus assembly protein TadG
MIRAGLIRGYFGDRCGGAAVEFALMLSLFTVALPSAIDLGIYAYDNMQVKNSAHMAAQAVWAACNQLPATDTSACSHSTLLNAVTNAAQQTSLGSNVTISSVREEYDCTNSSGALANAVSGSNKYGDLSTALDASSRVPAPPTDCSALSGALTSIPGDYFTVNVTYTYSPIFSHFSVISMLGTTIAGSATIRLL